MIAPWVGVAVLVLYLLGTPLYIPLWRCSAHRNMDDLRFLHFLGHLAGAGFVAHEFMLAKLLDNPATHVVQCFAWIFIYGAIGRKIWVVMKHSQIYDCVIARVAFAATMIGLVACGAVTVTYSALKDDRKVTNSSYGYVGVGFAAAFFIAFVAWRGSSSVDTRRQIFNRHTKGALYTDIVVSLLLPAYTLTKRQLAGGDLKQQLTDDAIIAALFCEATLFTTQFALHVFVTWEQSRELELMGGHLSVGNPSGAVPSGGLVEPFLGPRSGVGNTRSSGVGMDLIGGPDYLNNIGNEDGGGGGAAGAANNSNGLCIVTDSEARSDMKREFVRARKPFVSSLGRRPAFDEAKDILFKECAGGDLVKARSLVEARDTQYRGWTLIHYAAAKRCTDGLRVIWELYKNNPSDRVAFSIVDWTGLTPLHLAVLGCPAAAAPGSMNVDGESVLAEVNAACATINFLCTVARVDVGAVAGHGDGRTALHLAVMRNTHVNIIRELVLRANANPTVLAERYNAAKASPSSAAATPSNAGGGGGGGGSVSGGPAPPPPIDHMPTNPWFHHFVNQLDYNNKSALMLAIEQNNWPFVSTMLTAVNSRSGGGGGGSSAASGGANPIVSLVRGGSGVGSMLRCGRCRNAPLLHIALAAGATSVARGMLRGAHEYAEVHGGSDAAAASMESSHNNALSTPAFRPTPAGVSPGAAAGGTPHLGGGGGANSLTRLPPLAPGALMGSPSPNAAKRSPSEPASPTSSSSAPGGEDGSNKNSSNKEYPVIDRGSGARTRASSQHSAVDMSSTPQSPQSPLIDVGSSSGAAASASQQQQQLLLAKRPTSQYPIWAKVLYSSLRETLWAGRGARGLNIFHCAATGDCCPSVLVEILRCICPPRQSPVDNALHDQLSRVPLWQQLTATPNRVAGDGLPSEAWSSLWETRSQRLETSKCSKHLIDVTRTSIDFLKGHAAKLVNRIGNAALSSGSAAEIIDAAEKFKAGELGQFVSLWRQAEGKSETLPATASDIVRWSVLLQHYRHSAANEQTQQEKLAALVQGGMHSVAAAGAELISGVSGEGRSRNNSSGPPTSAPNFGAMSRGSSGRAEALNAALAAQQQQGQSQSQHQQQQHDAAVHILQSPEKRRAIEQLSKVIGVTDSLDLIVGAKIGQVAPAPLSSPSGSPGGVGGGGVTPGVINNNSFALTPSGQSMGTLASAPPAASSSSSAGVPIPPVNTNGLPGLSLGASVGNTNNNKNDSLRSFNRANSMGEGGMAAALTGDQQQLEEKMRHLRQMLHTRASYFGIRNAEVDPQLTPIEIAYHRCHFAMFIALIVLDEVLEMLFPPPEEEPGSPRLASSTLRESSCLSIEPLREEIREQISSFSA